MPRPLKLRRRPRQPAEDRAPAGPAADEMLPGAYEAGFEPFVPTPDEDAYALHAHAYRGEPSLSADNADTGAAQRRRLRVAGLRLGFQLRWGRFVLALALIAGGVTGTLLRQGRLREEDITWWPVIVLAIAGLWMLLALARRRVAAFLGGAALAGVGFSALLDAQDVATLRETLLGLVLVSTGLGIVIRGFLLRGQITR